MGYRRTRLIWAGCALVACVGSGVAGGAAAAPVDAAQQSLQANAVHVRGVVVRVKQPTGREDGSLDARFSVAGVERVRTLYLTRSDARFGVGDPITVVYDRTDPDNLVADGVANESGLVAVLALCLLASLILFVLAAWWVFDSFREPGDRPPGKHRARIASHGRHGRR
ncbi:DUF3592 domain-containing protein [Actinokineospora inagensis]|uniref:DUF3592 domain-containing protein n=1 Tax=Actinokineospora inagensis TaxID=103730 RepID=UPI000418F2CB|nr:DUF3592 domain-containing protein [Actinokineospora inagensis]